MTNSRTSAIAILNYEFIKANCASHFRKQRRLSQINWNTIKLLIASNSHKLDTEIYRFKKL
jgi:hypothetical protein